MTEVERNYFTFLRETPETDLCVFLNKVWLTHEILVFYVDPGNVYKRFRGKYFEMVCFSMMGNKATRTHIKVSSNV